MTDQPKNEIQAEITPKLDKEKAELLGSRVPEYDQAHLDDFNDTTAAARDARDFGKMSQKQKAKVKEYFNSERK